MYLKLHYVCYRKEHIFEKMKLGTIFIEFYCEHIRKTEKRHTEKYRDMYYYFIVRKS